MSTSKSNPKAKINRKLTAQHKSKSISNLCPENHQPNFSIPPPPCVDTTTEDLARQRAFSVSKMESMLEFDIVSMKGSKAGLELRKGRNGLSDKEIKSRICSLDRRICDKRAVLRILKNFRRKISENNSDIVKLDELFNLAKGLFAMFSSDLENEENLYV